jgi:hypothetical protein
MLRCKSEIYIFHVVVVMLGITSSLHVQVAVQNDNRSGSSLLICAMHDPNNMALGSNIALAA